MVNVELGNEMWKMNFFQYSTSVGRRKYPSPQQESNPWPPKHMAGALSTELQELMESNVIFKLSSYVTYVSPAGDSDIFFVPRLCHIEKFIFHISLPSSTFTIFIDLSPLTKILTVLILAEGRTPVTYTVWNSVKWPCSSWVFVVPSCVWEVVGSIPVGTQIFCLSHAHVILKKIHMSKRCFTQGFPWLCFGHIHLIWKTKLSDSLRTSKFKVIIYTRVLYWKEHYS